MARPRLAWAWLLLLLACRAQEEEDECKEEPTTQELKSRPWFCEPVGSHTDTDDRAKCLGAGHKLNRTDIGLCRGRWQWYQLTTVHDHEVPYYEIATVGGMQQHVRKIKPVKGMRHAVAFHLQTAYCPYTEECGTQGEPPEYYTTVDVLVTDGEPRHPWDSDEPFPNPYPDTIGNYYRGDPYSEMYRYYQDRKSLAITFGYHTNLTRSCAPRLQDKVNIGVYCSWDPKDDDLEKKRCQFELTASLIPEYGYDGLEIRLPISPAGEKALDNSLPDFLIESGALAQADPAAQYFALEVGPYDIINVSIERDSPNQTYVLHDGSTAIAGHGLLGHIARSRGAGSCPSRLENHAHSNITLADVRVDLEHFCTSPFDTDTYWYGVLAANEFGPFPGFADTFGPGMVGPDGQPLDGSDPRAPFREQIGWGFYVLRVHHEQLFDSPLLSGETRPACINYGQWRTYTITTSGLADAVLELSLGADISSTLMRTDAPPTLDEGDVVYGYAAGTPPTTAVGAGEYNVRSPPGQRLVTGSPCDMRRATVTTWHVAMYMAPPGVAAPDGLAPARFDLAPRLRRGSLVLGERVAPNFEGGRGFVCCGGVRYFSVEWVPELAALQVDYRTLRGRVKNVYLKWGGIPEDDVSGHIDELAHCPTLDDIVSADGTCKGFCAMGWLTTRGPYSGRLYSTNTTVVRVPHGHGGEPDRRRAGSWFVGVQAMPGETAEFELTASLYQPIYAKGLGADICTKLTPACGVDSARRAWNQPGYPAPPPSEFSLEHASALERGEMTYAKLLDMIGDGLRKRVLPALGLLLGVLLFNWCFRTYRMRRRSSYRQPHDPW